MIYLRNTLIGMMTGGAVGAKSGAFLSGLYNSPEGFQWIESGMLLGVVLGLLIPLLAAIADSLTTKTSGRATSSNQVMPPDVQTFLEIKRI